MRHLFVIFLLLYTTNQAVAINRDTILYNDLQKLDTLNRNQLFSEVELIYYALRKVTDHKAKIEITNYIFELTKKKSPEAHVLALTFKVIYADTANPSLYDEAYKIAEELNNEELMMMVEVNRSNYFIEHQNYDKAMYYLLRLLDLTSVSDDVEAYRNTLNLLGDIYYNAKLYEQAKEIYTELLAYYIDNSICNYWRPYTIMNNLGQIAVIKGDYKEALSFFKTSKNTADTCLFQPYKNNTIGFTILRIAEVYLKQQKLDLAQTCINKVEKMPKNTIYENVQQELLYQSANLQYLQGKYNEALKNATVLYPTDSSIFTNYRFIPKVYKLIADIYIKQNDYPVAMQYMQKYNHISDSINLQSNIAQSMILLSTKNHEKTKLDLKNTKQKIIMLLVGIAVLISIFIIVLLFYRKLYKSNMELVRKSVEKVDLIENTIAINNEEKLKTPNHDEKEQQINIIINLKSYVENNKAFLNPKLSILEIANKLSTNRTYLSKAINNQLNISFPIFINEYRIREAIRLIRTEFANNHTIEALAIKSGFASRTVFINAFKKQTGVTPSFFIANYKKLEDLKQ